MTTPPPPSDAPGQPPIPPGPPSVPPVAGPPAPPLGQPDVSGAPVYGYPHPDPQFGYPQQAPQAPAAQPGYGYPDPSSQPGYGYPADQSPGAPQPLVTLGDIAVTSAGIITPAGTIPLKGAVWTATDLSRTEEKTSTAGIVLAIIFFLFCLIGLLFLLMKERRTVGHIQITVNGGGTFHSTSIPVNSPQQVADVMNRVNYARSLAV